jgi:hypothetical protein
MPYPEPRDRRAVLGLGIDAMLYYIVYTQHLARRMISKLKSAKHATSLDATGVGLSVLCMAHCLFFPIAATAAPMLVPGMGHAMGTDPTVHIILFLIAAPVSLIGLLWGIRASGGGKLTLITGLLGLVLMGLGFSHLFASIGETLLTASGVSILAGAHIANWRTRARAGHIHERDCNMCEPHSHEHDH